MVLGVACLFSALAVVHIKHQSRKAFIELQQLEQQRDRMDEEWSQLLLEEGAWSSFSRVEQLARERLQMRLPRADEVVMIEAHGRIGDDGPVGSRSIETR